MAKVDIQQIKQRFGIIGNHVDINRSLDVAIQVAPTDLSVLITGESGVGKEFFPQIIHQFSSRKHENYIAVNCGAIPEGTINSELFGHEKGSFTGALADRKGYFEVADKGTIFLDEVGELPLSTQAQLLRVLESGEFIRVGSSKVQKTNVRIVAATNLDMKTAVAEGKFREDLFYRLNTVPIHVPALRHRGEDTTLLFRKFAVDFSEKYRMPSVVLTAEAKLVLQQYRWPGNVRQLKNITEQISIIETQREITPEVLLKYLPNDSPSKLPTLLSSSSQDKSFASEREILYQVLFDMKKDVTDLKKLVHDLMSGRQPEVSPVTYTHSQEPTIIRPSTTAGYGFRSAEAADMEIQDTEEYIEEAQSLEEVEKEMIKKALFRHNGRRKNAAQDLRISERTLYRKIKEYDLE